MPLRSCTPRERTKYWPHSGGNITEPDTIWITRSEPGASATATALQELHRPLLVHPVIRIQAIQPLQVRELNTDTPLTEQNPGAAPTCVIVVSGHAVAPYVELRRRQPDLCGRQILHIAVGRQTARMLEKHAIIAAHPEQMDSEGILAMPEVRQLPTDAVIWLIGGLGGRDVLGKGLIERGHPVVQWATYERVANPLSTVHPCDIAAIVVASEQGLRLISAHWEAADGDRSVTIIAPSQRVCDVGVALGFTNIVNAGGAAATDVLDAVRSLP